MGMLFHFGRYLIMLGRMFSRPEKLSMYWKETARQMNDIGIGSFLIVAVISIFIGAVTAVQFAYQLQDTLVPIYYIGYIVRDSTIIELAPTITCLVLAGKVGSNMAAEIGGMRQKEQIDALEIMGVNTYSYIIGPKILAGITVIPLLVICAAFMGIAGGMIAAISSGYVSFQEYETGLHSFFNSFNVVMMLIKAVVFAFILTSVSCYQGFYVEGGSVELGKASTAAVVLSDILILLSDYFLALLLT